MKCDYFAALRHAYAENNEAEAKHKAGDSRAYDKAIKLPSSCHDLTEAGKREAIATGEWLYKYGFEFSEHIVSGFLRAMRTASLLDIRGARWRVEERLCEKDSGILNTLTPSKVKTHIKGRGHNRHELDPYRNRPENGESFLDLDVRARSVFDELTGRPLVVCHGHVIRFLDRVYMEGMSAWEFSLFNPIRGDIPNCSLIEYKTLDGETWLRRMSVPTEGKPPSEHWTPIIPKRHSSPDLNNLVEKVLERVRAAQSEAAE